MTNRTLNVGDIVFDTRFKLYEIINEIDYEQDTIIVRGLFDVDHRYTYSFKVFYDIYNMISSVGD
jgi:ATP sulfurylase